MAWLRRILRNRRARWTLVSLLVVAVAGGVLALATRDTEGPDLDKLEKAGEQGSIASEQSARITQNLERIAENLDEGAGLSETSEEIHQLTEKQQQSLADLADLLRGQLASIKRTGQTLETSEESARGVEAIGERESERIKATLDALETLEAATRGAVERSADLAKQALYGARLAEDSADSFSGP